MTVDQQKAIERLERCIQREQLVSVMNDTKWRELQAAMTSIQPRYRVKCLSDRSDQEALQSERDWAYHLPLYRWIEWVEIDPICRERRGRLLPDIEHDMAPQILALLRERSIPHEMQSGGIWIYGYRRTAR